MKRNRYFLLGFFIIGTGLAIWEPMKVFVLKDKCLDHGGKWASNGNYCINPDCALEGSCRPSYNNNVLCYGLSLGISQEELYFNLGMPVSINDDEYIFEGGALESSIKAVVKNRKLYKIKCRT